MDDVCDFEGFVKQRDVAVGEVDGCTGCGREVVICSDGGGDNQVVNDFTVDFGNHLVGHEVGEGGFGVDVVNGLEVLCGFERPGSLELSSDGCDAITVDAQGDFGLEGVGFEVVLVVDAGYGSDGECSGTQRDLDLSGAVVECGCSSGGRVDGQGGGEVGAVADEDYVGGSVAVVTDAEAGNCFFAVGACFSFGCVDFDDYGSGEDWSVGEGCRHDGSTCDGCVFAAYFLRGVVRVECPTVLFRVRLCGVLTHDLGSSDRLSLGEGVAVSDVEDQGRGLTHGLDADEVVGDELRIGLADERQGESCEVGDVGGGRLVFEDDRAIFGVPGVELVFEDGRHEAELLGTDFAALAKDGGPFLDELVSLGFVDDCCFVQISLFGDGSSRLRALGEVALAALGSLSRR